MPITITMPALSPTMEEGTLLKWLVKEGDKVQPGDVIAEIETDKATMEVEVIDEGVVAKILIPEGTQGVKVNSLIAVLAEEDDNIEELSAFNPEKAQGGVGSVKQESAPDSLKQEKGGAAEIPGSANTETKPMNHNADHIQKKERTFASPLARRLAEQAGIDIASIQGSGPRGRVIKSDIEQTDMQGQRKGIFRNIDVNIQAEGSENLITKVPHDSMRKTIARRLVEAKSTIPHFYLKQECRIDELLSLRAQINSTLVQKQNSENTEQPSKISVNDMIIRALALALRDVPAANVSWSSENMLVHKHSDIAVAVSVSGGIMTPIIRQAELKSLLSISHEMKSLIIRAKSRKLKPEEYEGGTTSISNLGMLGIDEFSAIINPPQTTILAVGTAKEKAIVKNKQIEIATLMSVTLSVDHRALDGALAGEMLQSFRHYIENPLNMLL